MKPSQLQAAIDAAWPGVEAALASTLSKNPSAKSLVALKDAFVRKTLAPTATDVRVAAAWGPWHPEPAARPQNGVFRQDRRFQAIETCGLHDLASSVVIDVDGLEAIGKAFSNGDQAPKKGSAAGPGQTGTGVAPDPVADDPRLLIHACAEAAVQQQFDDVTNCLRCVRMDPRTAATLPAIADRARDSLGLESGALTMLVETTRHVGIPDDQRKVVQQKLGGGTIIGVPGMWLADQAVVIQRKPRKATWYVAFDFRPAWSPTGDEKAVISVVSRHLLLGIGTVSAFRANLAAQ